MLCKLHCMVLPIHQNVVYHWSRDLWSAYQAMYDSHFSHCRELLDITRSVIITTGSSVQLASMWNSVLPQSENPSKDLALLIQYPQLLSYYHMVCCCVIWAGPTHFGCSYEYSGIWRILEFELDFCALTVAHFRIHVENIQMICKTLGEPPLQMTNLARKRTK